MTSFITFFVSIEETPKEKRKKQKVEVDEGKHHDRMKLKPMRRFFLSNVFLRVFPLFQFGGRREGDLLSCRHFAAREDLGDDVGQ